MRSQFDAAPFNKLSRFRMVLVTCFALLTGPAVTAAVPSGTPSGLRVNQYGHSLFIHGTGNSDRIWIGQFANGNIAVLDLDANGVQLKFKGGDTNGPEVFSGVRSIFVNTFGGNDLVVVTNQLDALIDCLDFDALKELDLVNLPDGLDEDFFIRGELEIVTGNGRDVVAIGGVRTGYSMEVFSDNDADEVGFCDIDVGQNLLVYTGHGRDDVLIRGVELKGDLFDEEFVNYVRYSATIDTGGDHDDVCVEDLLIDYGSLVIVTLDGNDDVRIGACFFDEPEGIDFGLVSVAHNLIVDTGWGNDEVALGDTAVGLNLIVVLGHGYDDCFADEIFVDHLAHINAGNDSDYVFVNDLEADWLEFFMGNGNDDLIVEYSSAWRIFADGGPGYDCFDEFANWFNHEIIFGFESFDCK